jgi:hypothetical protein
MIEAFALDLQVTQLDQFLVPAPLQFAGNQTIIRVNCIILPARPGSLVLGLLYSVFHLLALEAADILEVSGATADRMVSTGVLPAHQFCTGAPWIIRLADLRQDAVCRDAEARRPGRPISRNPPQNSLLYKDIAR